MKHSALLGLRELLALSPSLLEQHLSRLLSEVAAVFADKDGNVRAAATRVLKSVTQVIKMYNITIKITPNLWFYLKTNMLCSFVFSRFIAQSVPAERVAPFFQLLSAHLSCAMTHIEAGIQEDSLKVLDVLLEHYPALLAERPTVLLTNFLELISHRQGSAGAKRAQDVKGRTWTLTINLGRAVTSQQWRLSVLLRFVVHVYTDSEEIYKYAFWLLTFCLCSHFRLGRFLQAVVDERPVEECDIFEPGDGVFGTSAKRKVAPLSLSWEELTYSKINVKLYEHSGAKPSPRSTFRLRYDDTPCCG